MTVQFHEQNACHGCPPTFSVPGSEAVPARLAGTIPLGRDIFPTTAGGEHIENTVHRFAVVGTGTTRSCDWRHERSEERPFLVGEV